jgi:hypothetical protein
MSNHVLDSNLPIACTLSTEERPQRGRDNAALFVRVEEAVELPDGYAYRLPNCSGCTDDALSFIRRERECCRFFRFELHFQPDLGSIWLHVKGPEEAKELLKANFRP